MILITKCFEVWSPEAIICGETFDKGIEYANEPCSFLDLVRELRLNFRGGQVVNVGSLPTSTWVESSWENYRTGEREVRSLHFSHENKNRAERYWSLALKAADLIK